MTSEEFIDEIVKAYKKAYDLASPKKDERVERGKQHPISGIAEDLFAIYLADKIKGSELKFHVDRNISVKINPELRRKSFRPDLYILKNNVVTHYFDFKTDLGWNRNFSPYLNDKNERVKSIRGKSCRSFGKELTISDKIKYQVILLSGSNGGDTKEHMATAAALEGVEMYIITKGNHPNSKNREKVIVVNSEFDRLIKDTKEGFNS